MDTPLVHKIHHIIDAYRQQREMCIMSHHIIQVLASALRQKTNHGIDSKLLEQLADIDPEHPERYTELLRVLKTKAKEQRGTPANIRDQFTKHSAERISIYFWFIILCVIRMFNVNKSFIIAVKR